MKWTKDIEGALINLHLVEKVYIYSKTVSDKPRFEVRAKTADGYYSLKDYKSKQIAEKFLRKLLKEVSDYG